MGRRAMGLEIAGRGDQNRVHLADAAGHQRLIGELAGPDHAVHILAQQVHHIVRHPRSIWISG